jgi:integrase
VQRLKPTELQSLLDGCSLCRTPWLKPIIEIAVETGLRRGEILALRWQEVDWMSHTVYIPETKTGEPRCVPLSPRALAILQPLHKASTDERVFPTSADAVKKAWQRLISRIGIVDRHFHDLRHEAISRFFELGLSLPEVALISGHKDPRMLFRYTHMSASLIASKLSRADSEF